MLFLIETKTMDENFDNKLITIGEAAKMLGVSKDTLRRWDESGAFPAIKSSGRHRYYARIQVELYRNELYAAAKRWVMSTGNELPISDFYCENQPRFQSRLMKMGKLLEANAAKLPWFSLIILAVGEMGNNSFDHNIGNWPNVPGTFYAFDLKKGQVVLADRGRGVLATLRNARPELASSADALRVAFTEYISGRTPEKRGNGLKSVRAVVEAQPLSVMFRSGNALAILRHGETMKIERTEEEISGCLIELRYK